jgi:hypothetical protein
MNRVANLCEDILIADMAGDRPAKVTKVYAATSVEVCAFMPLPKAIKVVTIHNSRAEAINATQRGTGYHAYWKP